MKRCLLCQDERCLLILGTIGLVESIIIGLMPIRIPRNKKGVDSTRQARNEEAT